MPGRRLWAHGMPISARYRIGVDSVLKIFRYGQAFGPRLLGRARAVVERVDVRPVLLEHPGTRAAEVALGTQRRAFGAAVAGGGESPAQGVRQPALGVQVDHAADAVGIALLQDADVEIDRGPPAREVARILEHGGHLFSRASD